MFSSHGNAFRKMSDSGGDVLLTEVKYHFCTYFDSHYLTRGLALYSSLLEFSPPFQLWVLCLDDETERILSALNLSNIRLIPLAQLEAHDHELAQVKSNRSRIEYYFTVTPCLPQYILNQHPEVDVITYLDADLLFFSDLTPIFDELGSNSVLIIPHRFPATLKAREKYGLYNVQFLSFRRDEHGLACLGWWRERCLEWCYDRLEGDRFADQKYLDVWPGKFKQVVVLQNVGAGVAPWNLANYTLRRKQERSYVDEHPLIFFHFHGFKRLNRWSAYLGLGEYKIRASRDHLRHLYGPYLRKLEASAIRVESGGFVAKQYSQLRRGHGSTNHSLMRMLRTHEVALTVGPLWLWL
jgi:hypothetical protein